MLFAGILLKRLTEYSIFFGRLCSQMHVFNNRNTGYTFPKLSDQLPTNRKNFYINLLHDCVFYIYAVFTMYKIQVALKYLPYNFT